MSINHTTTGVPSSIRPALQLIARAPETLDFSEAIVVNRHKLASAHRNITRANNLLHEVEGLDELNPAEYFDLLKLSLDAAGLLGAMLNGSSEGGGAAR